MSTTTLSPTTTATPAFRLTRRGRLVVFAFGLLLLAAVGLVFAGASMATGEAEATETIVVAPGETLWSIAAEAADDGAVRDMMSHLVELNDLSDVALDAGQRLEVPAG